MKTVNNVQEAWITILQDLSNDYQNKIESRIGECKEIINYSICIENPVDRLILIPERKMNYSYNFAEFAWIMGGDNNVNILEKFNKRMASYSDNLITLSGAYGSRLLDYWGQIIYKLKNEKNSRQLVMPIFNGQDLKITTKDTPCTVSFQFIERNGFLNMIVNMRSNDAWLGFPYDAFTFTAILELLALTAGLKVGKYYHNSGSMHLYSNNYEDANNILKQKMEYSIKDRFIISMNNTLTINKIKKFWYSLIKYDDYKFGEDAYSISAETINIANDNPISDFERIMKITMINYYNRNINTFFNHDFGIKFEKLNKIQKLMNDFLKKKEDNLFYENNKNTV